MVTINMNGISICVSASVAAKLRRELAEAAREKAAKAEPAKAK